MAETPNRADNQEDDEDVPPLVVPSRDPLPPPPDISFTRPTLGRPAPTSQQPFVDGPNTSRPAGSPGINVGRVGAGLASGLTFGAGVVGGILVGGWLDHHFPRIAPWGTIVFLLVGIAAGFLNIYRLLSNSERND